MKLHDLWKPIPPKPAPSKVTKTGEVQPARPPQPEKPPPKPHPPVPPKPPKPPQPPKDGGEYKPTKQVKQLKQPNQEQVRDLAGAGVVAFAWGMGTALLRVMRGIVAPAHGTGPTTPRPPLRACPRHPPLGLGTRWSGRWVLLPRPQPHPLGGLWFCSWVETLAYPDPSHRPLGSSSRSPPGPVSRIPGVRASRETLNLRRDRETRIGPPRRSSERHPTGLI